MALTQRLTSSHFPYLPLRLEVRQRIDDVEALLDTGFDGDVALPAALVEADHPPDGYLPCRLADGSEILTPLYRGAVRVGSLSAFPVVVIAVGDERSLGAG